MGEPEAAPRTFMIAGRNYSGGAPPVIVGPVNDTMVVSVRIRNVGVGLAIIDPRQSHVLGWPDLSSFHPDVMMNFTTGSIENAVLPPGEQARLEFVVDLRKWRTTWDVITGKAQGGVVAARLACDVAYTDAMVAEVTVAHIAVMEDEPGRWFAYQVDYFRPPGVPDPFVSSRYL